MPNFNIATIPAQMVLGELLTQGVKLAGQIADYKHKMAQVQLQHQQMMQQAKLAQQQIANQLDVKIKRINALQSGFDQAIQHFAKSQQTLRDQSNHNQQVVHTLLVLMAQCTAEEFEAYQTLLRTLIMQQAEIGRVLGDFNLQIKEIYAIYGRDVTESFEQMRDVN